MTRSLAGLMWSIAACVSMAAACWADIADTKPASQAGQQVAASEQPAAEAAPQEATADAASADKTASDPQSAQPSEGKGETSPARAAESTAGKSTDGTPATSDAASHAETAAGDAKQSEVKTETATTAAAEQGTASAASQPQAELIEERYPNRQVKIERHVVLDSGKNYVNHGRWTMFDEKGRMLGCGDYWQGVRHGLWTRWYIDTAPEMFDESPYEQFEGPFVSEAIYNNGKLDGTWAIFDSRDRKCSEFSFVDGERHGTSTWFYPNGEKMREIDFVHNQIDGTWQEWSADKAVTKKETYLGGRRSAHKTESYANGGPKSDTTMLYARETLKCDYDWWNAEIVSDTVKEGVDERQGKSLAWYQNGQKEREGEYDHDRAIGTHTWWYENGQKMIEGTFAAGERTGTWTWWHANGQKKVAGEFAHDKVVGSWMSWDDTGKFVSSVPYPAEQPAASAAPTAGGQVAASPRARSTRPTTKQAQAPRKSPSSPTRR